MVRSKLFYSIPPTLDLKTLFAVFVEGRQKLWKEDFSENFSSEHLKDTVTSRLVLDIITVHPSVTLGTAVYSLGSS